MVELSDRNVSNEVINALLEAIFDVLDKDGQRSILVFAKRDDLLLGKLPEGYSRYDEFLKILNSMRVLLEYSSIILHEIGRKFSIYLDPHGSSFEEFVDLLNNSFVDPQFFLKQKSNKEYLISICTEMKNTKLLFDPWMTYFYQGIFLEGLRKSIGGDIEAIAEEASSNHQSFTIRITQNHTS